MYDYIYEKKKTYFLGILLKRGSSTTLVDIYSIDAKGRRICSINLGKLSYLRFNSCFTQLITHSYT